jgi:hypothetical protein
MRGVITEVREDSFSAEVEGSLLDRDAEADFDIDEVSRFDRELITQGATFYWTIGFRTTRDGTRSESSLYFTRSPRYTLRDIEAAKTRVKALKESFGWD